jgi:ubiquinone/menaquinone biosynthesis C-methylase UbiE
MTALSALRPPTGLSAVPEFDHGWRINGTVEPFLAYEQVADLNWSAELEELHEDASRDHFIDVLTRWALMRGIRAALSPGALIVDVGCSSGWMLADLRAAEPAATTVGVDLVPEGLRRAHAEVPDAPLLLADCLALPLEDASVDAVVSANVLEHVADDERALGEIHRILKPGGLATVIVPAGPGIYDAYDEHLGHERRYARHELAGRGERAGFEVLDDAYLGSLVFPPFWLTKKVNRRRHRNLSDAERQALVERSIAATQGSRLGDLASAFERELLKRKARIPFGIRSVAVFRRPA